MAHELDIRRDGSAQMFSANGVTPWHRLGKIIEGTVSPGEAQHLAGADFEYAECELCWEHPATGAIIPAIIKGNDGPQVGILRTDTNQLLHAAGTRYEIVQPAAAFDFFEKVAAHAHVEIETAGVLREGRTVWALAKVAEGEAVQGDPVAKYVLFTAGLGESVIIKPTNIRVVCANTEAAAISDSLPSIRLKHTKSVHSRIEQTANAVIEARTHFAKEIELRSQMAKTRCDPAKFFSVMFPQPKDAKRDTWTKPRLEAMAMYHSAPGSDVARGSLYAAVNAVTRQIGYGSKAMNLGSDRYLTNLIDGALAKRTEEVFKIAVEMVDGEVEMMDAPAAAAAGVDAGQIGKSYLSEYLS